MTAHSHPVEEAGNQGVGASALPTGLSSLRDEAAKASSPEASIPSRGWAMGQRVMWPNGVVGAVAAVDFDDNQLMDHAGGWHDMADVDLLP